VSVSEFPVNKNPQQLLRFLGLSGPDAPSRVTDFIQGQADLLPWWTYSQEQKVNVVQVIGIGTVGFIAGTGLTVPAGRRWFVSAFSVLVNCDAAGEICMAQPAWDGGTGVFVAGPPTPLVQFAAATQQFGGSDAGLARGHSYLLLNAGERLGAFVLRHEGATSAQLTFNVAYTQFDQ
jgi:hypothetical protein